jgi:hypothetical protein
MMKTNNRPTLDISHDAVAIRVESPLSVVDGERYPLDSKVQRGLGGTYTRQP